MTTLGPYEIRGELGRGAMAVVWRGYDPRLDREIALKEPAISPAVDDSTRSEMAERFVREARAAARLNHPGVVTIFGADVYDGRPAIAMELVDGSTLADLVSSRPLDPAAALSIIDQLLDAVGYAHTQGIVHRDIKPDNVFVTHDGRVKLADFGIAHMTTSSTLTQAGAIMGTPGYMAPEQVTGGTVDPRTDLFAVGVIAYELLTGRNPFGATDGAPPTTVMYRVVHEPVPALTDLDVAGMAPHVAFTIAAALQKEPAARFAGAPQMRAALRGDLSGMPAAVSPVAVLMAPPRGETNRATIIAVAAGALACAVALFFVFGSSSPMAGGIVSNSGTVPSGSASAAAAAAAAQAPAVPVAPAAPSDADVEREALAVLDAYITAISNRDLDGLMALYADTVDPYFVSRRVSKAKVEVNKAKGLRGKWTSTPHQVVGAPTIVVSGPDVAIITYRKRWDMSNSTNYYRGEITSRLTLRRVGGTLRIAGEQDVGNPSGIEKNY